MEIPEEIYQTVLRTMPIPCVDLFVFNSAGEVLLVRRTNEPAHGQWWFPGGRVHFGETRETAAMRQLMKECGLHATSLKELWTRDVILPLESGTRVSHGITTLYAATVAASSHVLLDEQASDFAWKKPAAWAKEPLETLVRDALQQVISYPTSHKNAREEQERK